MKTRTRLNHATRLSDVYLFCLNRSRIALARGDKERTKWWAWKALACGEALGY